MLHVTNNNSRHNTIFNFQTCTIKYKNKNFCIDIQTTSKYRDKKMGNSPMTIGLKVKDPKGSGGRGGKHHVAGSILYGKVYLSVTEHEETATSIRLKVIGKENVVIHHTTTEEEQSSDSNDGHRSRQSSTTTTTRDHYEHSTHDIWNVDHPLKVFPNGKIPRGQYEFPFAVQLPESLPSTMYSECGQSTCAVRYEVVAEVFKKSNSFLYANPNAKEEINVAAKSLTLTHPDQDTSLQLPLEIVPINRCCCCSCTKQGSIALETKFDKSTLLLCPHNNNSTTTTTAADTAYRSSNENSSNQNAVMVQFRCQNKSTAKVGSVHVELIETNDWHVNGHKESVKKILAESKKDAGLYPELDPLWRTPTRLERRQQQQQQQQQQDDSESHLLLQYKPWHAIGPLVVPSSAKDTYRGSGIQVRHVLTVQLKTLGWCATNPDASSLVEIYRDPMTTTTTATATTSASASTSAATIGGVSHDDHLSCEQQQHTTPSAPFEDEFSSTTMPQRVPTAPSDVYDYDNRSYGYNNKNINTNDFISIPTVEAQMVLPEDWNAQTAETVNIPMAEATVLP